MKDFQKLFHNKHVRPTFKPQLKCFSYSFSCFPSHAYIRPFYSKYWGNGNTFNKWLYASYLQSGILLPVVSGSNTLINIDMFYISQDFL